MLAAKVESVPVAEEKHHVTFFRQSGWLMIATMIGGALMFAVHPFAAKMPASEYGLFTTLIQVITQIGVPAVGLQSLFAQQAAGVRSAHDEAMLAGTFRGVLRATFFIWLLLAVICLVFQKQIRDAYDIANPVALWLTIIVGLTALWRPALQGTMQGRQNFLWLGGILIADGVARFAAIVVIVGLLHYQAAGGVAGILIGYLGVLAVGFWFCRDLLRGPAEPIDWKHWLQRVVPLTLGMGVGIFMIGADMLFVRAYFDKAETGYYGAAGMIGRALIYFTTPIASVMFPKLARSAAIGEKSNALVLALGLTALAGAGAAVVCTFFPELPLRLAKYDQSYLAKSAPLIPWFGWCMLPLTLATVLLNGLMARSQFKSVPWVVAVAVGYGLTLYFRHDTFVQVIQTVGIYSTLLLIVCAWFTFHHSRKDSEASRTEAA